MGSVNSFILYNCTFVFVVIENVFLHISIQKSGLGERFKSFSHFFIGSVMDVSEVEIGL